MLKLLTVAFLLAASPTFAAGLDSLDTKPAECDTVVDLTLQLATLYEATPVVKNDHAYIVSEADLPYFFDLLAVVGKVDPSKREDFLKNNSEIRFFQKPDTDWYGVFIFGKDGCVKSSLRDSVEDVDKLINQLYAART